MGGGGISNDSGTLIIDTCSFTNNYSQKGTVFNDTGTLTVTNSTFNDNASRYGGGIYNNGTATSHGTATVSNSTFSANTRETDYGGAIYNAGSLIVYGSTFVNNSVTYDGGALNNTDGTASVQNCTFYGNNIGPLNSQFQGRGGAIYHSSQTRFSSLALTACTFFQNYSPSGDLYFEATSASSANLQVGNCIIAKGGSTATIGRNGLNVALASQGYNLVDDMGLGVFNATGDQVNTDPLLDPAGLQDNGGPTQTLALTSNSPAIDKGKSLGLTTDQRGNPRPVDMPGYPSATNGDGSDIGAFEENDSLQAGLILVVNSLSDHNDKICGGSDCTLREAIHRSNDSLGKTIMFGGGVTGTLTLTDGELEVTHSLAIVGPGARTLAINGNSVTRVLDFADNGGPTISGLTIENGRVAGTAGVAAQGGGIYNGRTSNLIVTDCAFTGNTVLGGNGFGNGSPGGKGQGGAIYSEGALTLSGCTFSSSNMATGGNGIGGFPRQRGGNGGAGQGGAVFNTLNNSSGIAKLTNCTFYNNTARGGNGGNGGSLASGGNGGNGDGGAVGNAATLIMTACTISSNNGGNSTGGTGSAGNGAAGVAGGGITNLSGGTANVKTTISANNVANGGGGADVDGAFTSDGYNLLGTGDHSTGFTATGDMKGTDANVLNAGVLGPPSNTGGPTDTFTLTSNSPAINASSDTIAPHRDQRGYLRTGRSDIGSYEYNGSLLNLISVTQNHIDLSVGVEVVKGKIYRIERKLNLTDMQWQTLPGSPDHTATGNDTEQFHDFGVITGLTHAFYHVIFVQ